MSNDVVYVPVPRRWLEPIYERLTELSASERPPPAGGSALPLDGELLARMYRESKDAHRRLLRFLADHPDRWFYSGELADELGLEHGARGLAGMLGAFGRRAKHRYGGIKPWESEWDSRREEARHRMRPGTATVILALED